MDQYAKRLYERAAVHENFSGGFITWEDFWNFAENSVFTEAGHRKEKWLQNAVIPSM